MITCLASCIDVAGSEVPAVEEVACTSLRLCTGREMKKEGPQEGLAPHFCRAKLRPGWVMCYAPLNLAHDFSQHSRGPIGP